MSDAPRGVRRRVGRSGGGTALVLLGAALVAGAAFAPWSRQDYRDALSGPLTITVNGGDLVPALVPLALVILAAWAASALSRGRWRQVLAVCAGLAGLGAAISALLLGWHVPADEFVAQLRRPAQAVGSAQVRIVGVLLASVGGFVAAAGSAVLVMARPAARARGGDYDAHDAPAARRDAAKREAVSHRDKESGPAAGISQELAAERWWRSLDVGVDPTADAADGDEPAGNGTDGDEPTGKAPV